jgi:hypothetical protein
MKETEGGFSTYLKTVGFLYTLIETLIKILLAYMKYLFTEVDFIVISFKILFKFIIHYGSMWLKV